MMLHQLSGVFAGMSFGFVVKKPEKSKVQLPISGCSSLRQKDHKLKSLAIRLRGPLSPQTGGKWRRSKPGRRRSRPGAAPHVHWHLGGQGMSLSAKDKEKLSGFFSQFLGPGRKQERQRKGRAGSAKATAQIRTAKTPSKRGIREASCSAAPLLRLCSKDFRAPAAKTPRPLDFVSQISKEGRSSRSRAIRKEQETATGECRQECSSLSSLLLSSAALLKLASHAQSLQVHSRSLSACKGR